mgnify:CR=1 FL=1
MIIGFTGIMLCAPGIAGEETESFTVTLASIYMLYDSMDTLLDEF